MAEGAARSAWAHTSALLALIANVNRDAKKTRAYKPSDFDPYARKVFGEQVPPVRDIDILKKVFVDSACQGAA